MSVHISSAVWSNRSLKGSQKFVLLKFADLADDEGENAWPSVARVSAECGLGERTVQRIVSDLIKNGYLELMAEENTLHPSRTYRVVPDPRQNGTGAKRLSKMAPDPLVIRSLDQDSDHDEEISDQDRIRRQWLLPKDGGRPMNHGVYASSISGRKGTKT